MTKASTETSEITVMPFNYLLDWNLIEKNNFSLKNSVIIFDEAHNVDSLAEEGSSLEISSELLTQSLGELKGIDQAIKSRYLHKNFEESPQNRGFVSELQTFTSNFRNKLKEHSGKEVVFNNLHDIMESLKCLTSYADPTSGELYAGLNLGNYEDIFFTFERTIKIFNSKGIPSEHTGLFYETLKRIFTLLDENHHSIEEDYYVSISRSGQGAALRFNCLNASISFNRITQESPRSIILCSGTLGPF